jgi:hypothetical protein
MRLGNMRARLWRMDRRTNRDTVRRRGVLDDLSMRAVWGRGDLGEGTLERRARMTIEAEGRGREAGAHRGGLLTRCAPDQRVKSSTICTKVLQAVNRKVVDLTTLYNFHKGRLVFFSTDFTGM